MHFMLGMLCSQLLIVCTVVPVSLASFVEEEEMSFVQLTVERNWKRGKATLAPAQDEMEDDISFMQTKVTNEHRIKQAADSYDVHHMAAGVAPDGDVDVVEEGITMHRDRPPLTLDDDVSLMQTTAERQCRSADCGVSDDAGLDFLADYDAEAEAMEVSMLQTSLHVKRRPFEPYPHLTTLNDDKAGSDIAPPAEDKTWLNRVFEKLGGVRSWELQSWASFALCLLVLECVIWKATQTGGLKSKELRMKMRSWGTIRTPAPPKRLSLTLPLRQLLDPSGGSVKLFGASDGVAFVATLLEDESGERTVQLSNAAEPAQAVMSVGPLPRSDVLEEGAAVHRYTTGSTLGALQSTGPDSWSLSKNGQTTLQISSSAPLTLAISTNEPEKKEVAWVKPLSEAKEPDYVDFSICEGGDPMLPVACAIAVLVALSPRPNEETDEEF